MSAPRFFGRFDAGDVEIPQLHVGCDRSMDEPNPVLVVRGEDPGGGTLFHHYAPALTSGQLHRLVLAVEAAMERERERTGRGERPNQVILMDLRTMLEVLERASAAAGEHFRLCRIVAALEEGESLRLGDDCSTVIHRDTGSRWYVTRWGDVGTVGGAFDAEGAVAIALSDRGLPRAESMVRQVQVGSG